jgi:hypothetical protein
MTAGSLVSSLAISSIGYVAFAYGKRQRRAPQLAIGLLLMIFPYFVDEALAMWAITGALLFALWFALKLNW